MRVDGRAADALRPVRIVPHYLEMVPASALISCGKTVVLCAASVVETVPNWMQGRGTGWVTGEYAMLPASTVPRSARETGQLSGRTYEIRRLIGRALRVAVDLRHLGERMVIVDCDVLQADGGTRTAAITGGYVALRFALQALIDSGASSPQVLQAPVAAVSVGIVDGEPLLDLCYAEDSRAEVDCNVVMNAQGQFIEVQSSAEHGAYHRDQLDRLLALAQQGIAQLLAAQAAL